MRFNAPSHRACPPSVLPCEDGVFLYHDEINVYGPVHRMGLVADEDGLPLAGMSNMIDDGYLFGIGVMEDDTVICSITPAGSLV